jgi:hypothetical protein
MPDLITASEYVAEWGYLETGQLLTRIDVVDDTTVDTVTAMQNAMETDGDLNADVVTALEVHINRAEAVIRAYIASIYTYPPEASGSSTSHPTLDYIAKVIARYYLHDQASERSAIPQVVTDLYNEYKELLMKIGSYKLNLEGLDRVDATITTPMYSI